MNSISFIDTEIDSQKKRILDIGVVQNNGQRYHSQSIKDLFEFIKSSEYLCGHNILYHDYKYLVNYLPQLNNWKDKLIDTLYLSPLLFPKNPYHALLKDDKLQTDDLNNPLNDAIKAQELFIDEVQAFKELPLSLQNIYFELLHTKEEFRSFFEFIKFNHHSINFISEIKTLFRNKICDQAPLYQLAQRNPIELAYALSLINTDDKYSITPRWVLKNYPKTENVIYTLRNQPCITGCGYCNSHLNANLGLKKYFGYDHYRKFGNEPLQERAVKAALQNKSLLAVFPTGGGKSITFQIPALMQGQSSKGLTVVISPLQSLMKDQVDNLEKRGIIEGVTINGLLDPIERAKSFERVENGTASILYISPESLRSKSIERLLLGRNIVRFVIDEAHCFSSWGQDFRVDYLYIGDFIKQLQEKKNLEEPIPISCFTATAKQKVIIDILDYFKEKLSLELQLFSTSISRTNLRYEVFHKDKDEDKYQSLRDLIEIKNCPTIIYVSRTRRAHELANRLKEDGIEALSYHGKMDNQTKTENQNAFINGDVSVMVATSAFGMGVDKKDVGLVIHYDISDSLENYVQEAGRAGRDENLQAECFILFNEEDLSKHFILLNQTKLSIKEIQQVWKAIKGLTKHKESISQSALEIARRAGWDDSIAEIETRVTTAIAALEDAGYIKRGQNEPRVFANSIVAKNSQVAIDQIKSSQNLDDKQKDQAIRIIKKLFSSKSKLHNSDEQAESRVDYISDHLGIVKQDVIRIINILRTENILADAKDLTAYVDSKNKYKSTLDTFIKLENFLLPNFDENEKILNIKELNEGAEKEGIHQSSVNKIKTILNIWSIKNWIKRQNIEYSKNHFRAQSLYRLSEFQKKTEKRQELSKFIIDYLSEKSLLNQTVTNTKNEVLVEFSILEIKLAFENSMFSFGQKATLDDIEDALFYLSRIDAIKMEGGFMVCYNRLKLERLVTDNAKKYTKDDYQKLQQFYESKIQQIHIVGEYAKKMIQDYKEALQFVEDYFQLNYASFLRKYFPGNKANDLKLRMTPKKFQQLFGDLSPHQLKIIHDNDSPHIVVAAGPGSGKTRVLVHKLASMLLMEDVKHEQLLMLTFSRAAATEFKKRLTQLVNNAAHFVEIRTFHSYCFDLIGKVGNIENANSVIQLAIEKIKNREIENRDITKTVLVIDEAQDMNEDEFNLIKALMEYNEEMRVIAVGDDDQNIYEFRNSDSKYFESFIHQYNASKYELTINYRSKNNLIELSNEFIKSLSNRLKRTPVFPNTPVNGKIKINIHQTSSHFILPIVNDVAQASMSGSTCILTRNNEDTLKISRLLNLKGIASKLIQSNDTFNLYDLVELRFFIDRIHTYESEFSISDSSWEKTLVDFNSKFKNSSLLPLCINLIKDFEQTRPKKKYKSDLESFIRESKLEDFVQIDNETIFVSTIHKAKGKEFDNVFLATDTLQPLKDEDKRLLYVAMTRAKDNLYIHTKAPCTNYPIDSIEYYNDTNIYTNSNEILIQLSHKDVWLGYFNSRQRYINELQSGDQLLIEDGGLTNIRKETILKFSKKFNSYIDELKTKGYILKYAKVNYIVHWWNDEIEKESKIILPELIFEKTNE